MSKIVVTGGAGFIGSHIASKLVEQGEQVVVFDDLSTGNASNVPMGAGLVAGTVLDLSLLKDAFDGVDKVYHLAAIASVPRSVSDPLTTNEVNIKGTLNVLFAAKEKHVSKVVFASSSSVYGDTDEPVQSEEAVLAPCSPYALSKLAGESHCNAFLETHGLQTVCLRYFNVYGSGQDARSQYALAIPAFIDRITSHMNVIMYGDGYQERDFIYIDDVVDASIYAANSHMVGVYNVGAGASISMNELARMIMELTGIEVGIEHVDCRAGDPRRTCANISRLISAGFLPRYGLIDGLAKVLGEQCRTE